MTHVRAEPVTPPDQVDSLVTVLDLVRSGAARTRPEIVSLTGLGRNVVTQRVGQLIDSGLLEEGILGPSTGGRAPRQLGFRAGMGHILVADLGATSLAVGLADLSGLVTSRHEEALAINDGPDAILGRVDDLFREILAAQPAHVDVWGVGLGVPGPVEFRTGLPVSPPIMAGWDGFDIRGYFASRYAAPMWVDNDANVMALGELRNGLARGERDFLYVKIGSGIGAGLVSGGRLHRGDQGSAGDIGHIAVRPASPIVCRCGKFGCLEALAGGAALARDGAAAAAAGTSPHLERLSVGGHEISAADVAVAARHGDAESVKLLTRSAQLVGETLAGLVNFFNPSMVVLGGGVAQAGDLYLSAVRQAVLARSLPLATRSLRIVTSSLGSTAGLMGAAFMVTDALFSRELLGEWLSRGTPADTRQNQVKDVS